MPSEYEQAEREAPRSTVTSTTALLGFTRPDDFSFFQYICLSKLGRKEEALAKLARFRQGFRRREDGGGMWDGLLGDALKPDSFLVLLLRDLYMAEVFFSLDAARDAEAFFHAALKEAGTKPARLAASMVLSQVVLLQGQWHTYANIAIETVRSRTRVG